MKKLILTALLILPFLGLAHQFPESYDSDEQAQNEANYINNLNEFLIDHNDANISMVGLYSKLFAYHQTGKSIEKQFDEDQIYRLLNNLIKQGKLNAQGLYLAVNMCQNAEKENLCDAKTINKNFIDKSPQNIAAYLFSFNKAFNDNNQNDMNLLIKQMANAEISNTYQYISQPLNNSINEFINTNPLEGGFLENEIKQFQGINDLPEELANQLNQSPEAYYQFYIKVVFRINFPIPSYSELIEACKNNEDQYMNCLLIAETMINKGFTLLDNMVGYAINKAILKLQGEDKMALIAEAKMENFRKQYDCLNKAMIASNNLYAFNFDIEFFEIGNKLDESHGEYAKIKKMAELNYEKQLNLGFERAIDPKTCIMH